MTGNPNRNTRPGRERDLMERVAEALGAKSLSIKAAASAIGVGAATLEKHLAGEHVRSDSALKYRNWLEGRAAPQNVFVLPPPEASTEAEVEEALPLAPIKPRLVVDIFSGCGGLSLGFDLLGDGKHFRTILAVDNQAAPIAVLNRNAETLGHSGAPIGRQIDLTEFSTETEFLAFFIEHVAAVEKDVALGQRLNSLANGAFPAFREAIAAADSAYLHELNAARGTTAWQRACSTLDKASLGQTSVIGFHEQLRLPRTGSRQTSMPLVLWADPQALPAPARDDPSEFLIRQAEQEWDGAVRSLSARREASGRGQLSASARRVSAFVDFLNSAAMYPVRAAWARWRARRSECRAALFENSVFAAELRELYSERYPVSVLVGGPPCQGFSRIGRGKIRSLREAMVHVQGDAEAGDARNLLFRQYVMVLGSLRPDVFLFENVQHFQSTVKADGVEFQATEVLAEAIANISEGAVAYEVSSRVIDASRHGVPQTRQRYFMCGVRADAGPDTAARTAVEVLSVPRRAEVTLAEALAGLPQPDFVGGDSSRVGGEGIVEVAKAAEPHGYSGWVRRPPPYNGEVVSKVDGHMARAARADDAALFALMGPGKRWMDYRADDAPTVKALSSLLDVLANLPRNSFAMLQEAAANSGREFPEMHELAELRDRVNGSLPLRLILEQVGKKLGVPHHLLTETYLAKRDGHHGDWVARMDATRPAKTMVSHMGKDTYGYVHPAEPRTISVREAARVQTFPDWFSFGEAALTDAFKMVGNAVPPLLSHEIAARVATVLASKDAKAALLSRQATV